MQDGETLVFVEVRYRANSRYGSATETIDSRKQYRLLKTAQHYLQTHRTAASGPCRFDVVVIIGGRASRFDIEWIAGAFRE